MKRLAGRQFFVRLQANVMPLVGPTKQPLCLQRATAALQFAFAPASEPPAASALFTQGDKLLEHEAAETAEGARTRTAKAIARAKDFVTEFAPPKGGPGRPSEIKRGTNSAILELVIGPPTSRSTTRTEYVREGVGPLKILSPLKRLAWGLAGRFER
jgi:hypothetical protein